MLQSPWRTHQSRPHKRTNQSYYNRHGEHINPGLTRELIILLHRRANHPVPQESESSCPTRERIILFHKRANHLVPQESESSCSSAHHQGRVSHPWSYVVPVIIASPLELPELNVCNMQDPFTKVSRRLQVIQENHKFDLSLGLCPVHHLSAM